MTSRILVVDDDVRMCELLRDGLARPGWAISYRTAAADALAQMAKETFDVVITDVRMGGMTGTELCGRIASHRPDLPVIVITAFGSLETAVEAIRAGAYDFVIKPLDVDALALTVERALRHRALLEEVIRLRRVAGHSRSSGELLGESPVLREVHALIHRVADSDASVLITGESGTGKEVVARMLHRESGRRAGPFVAVNCGAIPETLLESELFGHVKGAFTDARTARQGLFLQAHGGTLFLDEIGDLPLALQPKLLRVIQERAVRPVGGDMEVAFDVRLVTATHRPLEALMQRSAFRQDLYFRLNVIQVALPPLRQRGNDVLLLARTFLKTLAKRAGRPVPELSPEVSQKLLAYPWPGNVRELQNCMERLVAVAQSPSLSLGDLPAQVRDFASATPDVIVAAPVDSPLLTLEEVERRHVLRVLESVSGNRKEAATILGLDRKTLYRKLDRYEESAPERLTSS